MTTTQELTGHACYACGHHHAEGPGQCWEAACRPDCPEDHGYGGPFEYTPDA